MTEHEPEPILDVDRIVTLLRQVGQAYGAGAALGAFAVASALAVPLTFLVLVTIVAFGPLAGMLCSVAGALLGAAVSHGVGRLLGHEAVRRLAGERVNEISRRLARRGILAVIAVRLVPVAPFAIINMVAGASHISLRDLLVGTAIGMMPSTLVLMFFVDHIIVAMQRPGPTTVLLIGLMLGLIIFGIWAMRRWLRQPARE